MSGAASTLHNININFAAAARGQMRCHPSRGSGDLRQRRHSSRVRPLPRVALWANQRTWEGFGHSGGATSAAASHPIPRPARLSPRHGNPSTLINSISWEGNMNKLYYPTLTHLVQDRDGRPTYFGESRTGLSDRLDQSSHLLPTSASTRPSLAESTRGRKKVGSTAGVIITRLLAVLVVAMVVTSILGFTLFDRQEGTSATPLVSLAIGGAAAVLGLIFGFREAHQAS
jgi:hypothetical protein